jgi:hypothetical protein
MAVSGTLAIAAPAVANPLPTVTVTPIGGDKCNVKVGSSATGGMLCNALYDYSWHLWPDGRLELFIIGWDKAMWHIYQPSANNTSWSSWLSMNGGFTAGPYVLDNSPLRVGGLGLSPNQTKLYCKHHSGEWSANWYQC